MKRLTLTFDNGPTEDVTPFVLDELATRGLRAWFAVVGTRLAQGDATAVTRRCRSEGHRVINHSLTHDTPLGEDTSGLHARREIVDMHHLMIDRLGAWSEPWFRPFGRGGMLGPHLFSEAALEILAELEYSVLLWNSVPRDWVDPHGWIEAALADIDRLDHTVVVLHDIPTGAMDQLGEFLDTVLDRGIEITDVPPDACIPIRSGVPTPGLSALTTP